MKLITKITLLYLILLLVSLIIGGVFTYQKVKDSVRQETDYALRSEARLVAKSIEENKPLDALRNEKIQITEISIELEADRSGVFSDTLMLHRHLKTMEPFRKHTSTYKLNNRHFAITVTDVFIEQKDMLEGVIGTMIKLFTLLSVLFLLFSILFSRWLLAPFHSTLEQIKIFDIRDKKRLKVEKTSTKEFNELNAFVGQMTEKARKDYVTLKEFTENASHEMQTPLAVAKGKLELLQESKILQENEHNLIEASQRSLTKLSKLGHALTLLTKLENQEYSKRSEINLTKSVKESSALFKELSFMRNISYEEDLEEKVMVVIDDSLADMLINNLLKNAVHHNVDNGWIKVNLTSEELIVMNSGNAPRIPTEQLMDRFKKSNQSSSTLGLGLSIIKKICDLSNWKVSYDFEDDVHQVIVHFKEAK